MAKKSTKSPASKKPVKTAAKKKPADFRPAFLFFIWVCLVGR